MDFKKYMAYLVVSDGANISYIRQDAYLVSDINSSSMKDLQSESKKEQDSKLEIKEVPLMNENHLMNENYTMNENHPNTRKEIYLDAIVKSASADTLPPPATREEHILHGIITEKKSTVEPKTLVEFYLKRIEELGVGGGGALKGEAMRDAIQVSKMHLPMALRGYGVGVGENADAYRLIGILVNESNYSHRVYFAKGNGCVGIKLIIDASKKTYPQIGYSIYARTDAGNLTDVLQLFDSVKNSSALTIGELGDTVKKYNTTSLINGGTWIQGTLPSTNYTLPELSQLNTPHAIADVTNSGDRFRSFCLFASNFEGEKITRIATVWSTARKILVYYFTKDARLVVDSSINGSYRIERNSGKTYFCTLVLDSGTALDVNIREPYFDCSKLEADNTVTLATGSAILEYTDDIVDIATDKVVFSKNASLEKFPTKLINYGSEGGSVGEG